MRPGRLLNGLPPSHSIGDNCVFAYAVATLVFVGCAFVRRLCETTLPCIISIVNVL